ncbi:ComEA family DNA-binding protein [Streptomyces sp. NPDC005202]|uniref:ComEA family DNA-binding protein n=1 Tax=Streptomyces sp. NPDC005202 TaxID=3157021 RepID=UPI0033B18223
MALRSRSRTATATSGPGRGPASDGRTRHRRPLARRGTRHRHASAEELRRRAEALFAERAGQVGESGSGPPGITLNSTCGAHPEPVRDARSRPSWAEREADPDRAGHGAHEDAHADQDGAGQDAHADQDHRVGDEDGEIRRDVPSLAAAVDAGPVAPGGAPAWRDRAGPALRERMPLWLQTRCALEPRNVIALAVLLVVAAVFAVQHFWTGRTQSVRAPEVVRAVAPYGARGEGRGAASGASAAPPGARASAGPEIVVDVGGKVRHPGIHRLPAGSRVADALRAAGGVRPGTNTDGLNRARLLVDGEQVLVGGPAPVTGAAPGGTAAGGAAGSGAAGAPSAPVSLNTATADQLETLPGVGPVLAQHIVDYRTQHGSFRSVDELREVNGIGDRRFADLRNLVRP